MITREQLRKLETRFDAFVDEFLEEEPEDIAFAWEFAKFLHTKKLKVLTAEKERMKKWKEELARP